jgi:hypothetical protein
MRRPFIASALTLAALTMVTVAPDPGLAQGQPLPTPPQGFRPPPPPPPAPPAPVKPYAQVAVTPPGPFNDPSFAAFRKNLAHIAARKDRAALAKLIVARGFFWMQDKDLADKGKPAVANLARAIDLDAKDGSGWDVVAGYAAEPTAARLPEHKGIICAPAAPTFDPRAFAALIQKTQTDPSEWAYPTTDGTEVRAAAQPSAPVIDKLGLNFVRVLADSAPADNPAMPSFLHVAMPSGKTGFVAAAALAPLGSDNMCYAKDASGWKITGYIGGVAP